MSHGPERARQHGVLGSTGSEECTGRWSLGGLGDLEPVRGAIYSMEEVSRNQQCSDRSMVFLFSSAVKDLVQCG